MANGAEEQIVSVIGSAAFEQVERLTAGLATLEGLVKQINTVGGAGNLNQIGQQATTITKNLESMNGAFQEVKAGTEGLRASTANLNKDAGVLTQQLIDQKATLKSLEKEFVQLSSLMGGASTSNAKLLNGEMERVATQIGIVKTNIETLSGAFKNSVAGFATVGAELTALRAEMARMQIAGLATSKGYQELKTRALELAAAQKVVTTETRAAEAGIVSSTKGLRSLFGVMRQIAYILPGIGIAGLFNLAFEAIRKVYEKLFDVETISKKVAKANEKYAESLKSIAENEAQSAEQEIAHMNVLASVAANNNANMKDRIRAVQELQKTYPDYFGSLTQEAILQGNVTKELQAGTNALFARAAAQAAEKRFAAAGETLYDLELQRRAAEKKLVDAQIAVDKGPNSYMRTKQDLDRKNALADAKKDYENILKLIQAARDAQRTYLSDAQSAAAEAGQTFFGPDPATPKGKKPRDTSERDAARARRELEEETKTTLKAIKGRYEQQAAIQKDAFENEKLTQKERLIALDKYTLDEVSIVKINGAIQGDTQEEVQAEITKILLRAAKERTSIVDQETKAQAKLEKDNLKAVVDFFSNGNTSSRKGIKRDNKEKYSELTQYTNDAISFANSLAAANSGITSKRIQEIDLEISKINELRDAEIERIEKSGKSAIQKEAEILEAKAKAKAQTDAMEDDRRRRQRRAAEFEKAVTIAQIIASTALAVVKQLAVPGAGFGLALATAAVGAAQLAAAIAQPIPAYKDGKDDTGKRGLAIVGDGGRPEVIETRDGNTYLTPSVDTLVDMPAHSIVHKSVEDFIAEAQYKTMQGMGIMKRIDERQDNQTLEEIKNGIAELNRTVRNKKETTINWSGLGVQHLVKIGGNTQNYIHNIKN